MAAAAYGAVVSLMHVLDNLQHPSRQHLHYDRNQIQTLCQNVNFLFDYLEDYSQILCHEDTGDLARQIAYAVDEAEEIIDYHVVDQLSQRSAYDVGKGLSSFREDIDNVLSKIESIKNELMMVKEQKRAAKEPELRISRLGAGSSGPPLTGKSNTMVGLDEHVVRIMDQLTRDESDLQIVPITGMGGIGKTTLAQNVFDNRFTVDRFDLRKWITISQSYSVHDVLLHILGEENDKCDHSLAELGGKLYKILFGRRYLMVMDDVWSTEVWDKLGRFFPNNGNRSRIIVTTRLSSVAVSLSSQSPYVMDFLGEEKSWDLFCLKAFGKEVCPYPQLQEIGKDIVECCRGLPLAIAVIGGLLGKSNMMRDEWEIVAKDVTKSINNSKDDFDCLNIFSWSYEHLPIHLKPCFLYMRMFPEDSSINVRNIIDYWIAEGLIKSKGDKTLEETAEIYLNDLIDRNLILIHEWDRYNEEILLVKVHDLLRDLCIREYEKENFFSISRVHTENWERGKTCILCCYRKASTWTKLPRISSKTTTLPTTLVSCFVCDACNIMRSHNRLRLVKVASDHNGVVEYLKPTRLRYISNYSTLESSSPTVLWNLQFLVVRFRNMELPLEIWEMPQLRRLNVFRPFFVDPPVTQNGMIDYVILENLQTLRVVKDFRCSEEIIKIIPNVKVLHIDYLKHFREYVPLNHPLRNLVDLHKLNHLICHGVDLEGISFPNSLKKLRLGGFLFSGERLSIVGSLPNLEVLKLTFTFGESEWNPVEGEFLKLKRLSLDSTGLELWNAEKQHFPKLEILDLVSMINLEKIPSGIGDIQTLRQIILDTEKGPVFESALEIIEEQRSYGNEELQLITYGPYYFGSVSKRGRHL